MAWQIEVTRPAREDLRGVFGYLCDSYQGYGYDARSAAVRARERVLGIERDLKSLQQAPYRGTLVPILGSDIRHVTKNRAIFYFIVDAEKEVVRVLSIFFGGQDHQPIMARRMTRP